MNKRIYFNNSFIDFSGAAAQKSQNQSIRFIEDFNEETLKKITKELADKIDADRDNSIQIFTSPDQFDTVFKYLKTKLYYIAAAGGLIKKQDKYLFILRFNRWDLPKGKLDKGETIEHAAVRECEEECAVFNLKIEKQLASTFHVYKYKDGYALKQTYWFFMTTDYEKELKPQLEENITEVKWFSKEEAKRHVAENSYYTIQDVVGEGFDEQKIF